MTWFAIGSALWLGILTSISPCPLASNIAAISFIGRKVGSTRQVFLSGLLYTIGRTAAYLALGVVIMAGLMASGEIARFLQRYLNQILGPVLILVGMLLLGLL
ncbi:MAG TPA: sulfite exporter TauE/SafE family protein, partial [Candidatus Hydrogenedentes bacterium]|nr:sulfite exporter TauE/SafE family protein [Candidatus Hydrogenedentota bacterium]